MAINPACQTDARHTAVVHRLVPAALLPVTVMLAAAAISGLGFHNIESSGHSSPMAQDFKAAAPVFAISTVVPLIRPAQDIRPVDATARRRAAIARQVHRQDQLFKNAFHRYEGDRLAFVQSLLPAAHAGDPQVQRIIALVLDLCATTASSDVETTPDREALECNSLNHASPDEVGTSTGWRAAALAGGDGQDLVRDAEDFSNGKDGNTRVAEFRRALAATDPGILRKIVGRARNGRDESAEFQLAVAELAQCKLGADCSGSGASLEVLCMLEDCRGIDSVQRLFELRLSPQDFVAADRHAQYIANRFVAGNDDWPEAQAFEQHLRRIAAQQAS